MYVWSLPAFKVRWITTSDKSSCVTEKKKKEKSLKTHAGCGGEYVETADWAFQSPMPGITPQNQMSWRGDVYDAGQKQNERKEEKV